MIVFRRSRAARLLKDALRCASLLDRHIERIGNESHVAGQYG